MCMTFGCNPQMKFDYIFLKFELSQFLPKHIGTGYPVNKTPPTILPGSF